MTVMLYPNKTDPKGYRVQDKILNINEYFPFSAHKNKDSQKSKDKALELANDRQLELNERRKYRELRLNLDINKLFNEDGSVIGLKRKTKKKDGNKSYPFQFITPFKLRESRKRHASLKHQNYNAL